MAQLVGPSFGPAAGGPPRQLVVLLHGVGADGQDLSFLQRRGHHRNYMAWAEIYAARFPERAESARLLGLAREADPDFRPMIDDYSGGNTTCLFAAP